MIKNKAIDVINTFSAEELKLFHLYLESPYFNSNKSLIKLFSEIRKAITANKAGLMTEELLYGKLYKGRKYNYGIMKNLMSELFKQAEKFLVININNNSIKETGQQVLLLGELDRRELDDLFAHTFAKTKDRINGGKINQEHYSDLCALYETEKDFYISRSSINKYSTSVLNIIEHTFPLIVSVLADAYAIQYTAEHSSNYKPQTDLVKRLISQINIEDFTLLIESSGIKNKEDMLIRLKSIRLLWGSGSDEEYYGLRDSVFKNAKLYSNRMLYTLINNYLLLYAEKRASEGSAEFFAEKFSLFRKMFTHVKMNSDGVGYIFLSSYLDTVLSGIKLGETEYVTRFTERFRKDVDPSVREVAYRLARAYIFAAEKNYEACLKELAQTGQADFHVKLRTKFLYLKCCFELSLFEQGFSMIDSFRKFVSDTRELHPDFRKKLNDSIKAYSALFKISSSPEKYSSAALEKQAAFVRSSSISPKNWYLEKLEELKRKFY
ncbi:MAG: hypothetical protein JNK43_04265 [Ignavibacteria bacterium]|nr:hypothetical protein [Ignavibacteria bacterium]